MNENENETTYKNIKEVSIARYIDLENCEQSISIGFYGGQGEYINRIMVKDIRKLTYNGKVLLSPENEINTPTVGQDYEALYKDALNKINEKIILIESYKMVIRDLLGREKR